MLVVISRNQPNRLTTTTKMPCIVSVLLITIASLRIQGGASAYTPRIVRTKYGDVSGVIVPLDSRHLEPVEVYRGVPYAMPPTGSLRFMPPVTGAIWSGVKIADKFGPVCPQRLPDLRNETAALKRMSRGRLDYLKRLMPYLREQSEDCLYLNIYAPVQTGLRDGTDGIKKHPVLVFIHGESYEWNSGNPYDGSVLASYGAIVVVTINYRLGILGFLNANTDTYLPSPSNYGLMDQIAALHWLQENIAMFGGDSSNVTIMGHGTGAACVHFLMTSKAVPDGLLFHRTILMSGSALSPWALVENPAYSAAQVVNHVECSPELPHAHLLKCLRDKPLEVLLSTPIAPLDYTFAFGPSVDGVLIDTGDQNDDATPFDQFPKVKREPPKNAVNMLASILLRKTSISKLKKYDLLLGVVKAEAYFTFNMDDVQYGIEADRRSRILRTFVKDTYSYHLSEIFATIVNEYTDWERPVQHPVNIRDETLEALSDAQFVAPIVHTADLHCSVRKSSTFLYVFDYQTKFGDYPQRQGCIHGEELPYLFGAPLVGGLMHFGHNFTKSEMVLSEAVMTYWSNFVRSGNPNESPVPADSTPPTGGSHPRPERNRFKNIDWANFESVHKRYLNLDTKPRLKNHFRAHKLSFWLNLVPDLHKPGGDDVPESHHDLDDEEIRPTQKIIPLAPKRLTTERVVIMQNTLAIGNLTVTTPTSGDAGVQVGVVPGSLESEEGVTTTQHTIEDGFAAYSTALSVTIAIGCSLLILNVLIFAGVYYQRDKSRFHNEQMQQPKKRGENGRMPNSICGDLESSIVGLKSDPATILSHHHTHAHHQMPPPEFTTLSQNAGTLPRPPPPPKSTKHGAENQPLLSSNTQLQMMNTGTLTKKNTQINSKCSGNVIAMDELRV